MIDDLELDPLSELPPNLSELERELTGIRIEERPSFGPELEAELAQAWLRRARWTGSAIVARRAIAASVAALVLTGLAVPPARASLATGLQRLLGVFQPTDPAPVARPETVPPPDRSGSEPMSRPATPPPPAAASETTRSQGEPLAEFPPFIVPESSYPTLLDPESEQTLMRRHYPAELQRRGIGGTVGVLLWVDSTGAVDNVQMEKGSGSPALDRAALQAAPALRFRPATRAGAPVGTWVQFDLVFEPQRTEQPFPEVDPVADPSLEPIPDWKIADDWLNTSIVPAPIRLEAGQLLRTALGDREDVLEARFGPLDGLLAGDPPAGVSPLRWRSNAASALERAMVRDPDNPAPYLALARIRRKQGLREDAQLLFERGIEVAGAGTRPVSPKLVAELSYEHGRVLRDVWLGWRGLGHLPADALEGRACPRRAGPSGDVDAEILIAWNYLCPAELGDALDASFEPLTGGEADLAAMRQGFREAIEAFPGHVGANVELLLDLADQELWMDVLNGGRRFAWATRGHPYALLLSGLALQRLGRAEEASHDLERALEALPAVEAARLRDPTALVSDDGGALDTGRFWRAFDPILSTDVNEREVEHLARAAYAFLRFGGLDSDAARVWLRYGRPVKVRAFGGAGLRTELWDYGRGPDLTFTRSTGSEDGTLTPEARAYLDDLRQVVPHWYGTRARPVYTLPAQVARFRGAEPGSTELDVHLTVPEDLKLGTAAGDSLELGVFVVGADGTSRAEVRRRIPASSSHIQVRDVHAAAGTARVVVELYDPRAHRAASVRVTASRVSEPALDTRVSDLLLAAPAAPMERTIGRNDAWVAPLTRADRLDGDELGVLFELYDLPATTDPYRVRVDLVSETDGRVIRLRFRPAGQSLFGEEWARRPAGRDGRAVEFLTLDLSSASPGRYTLRTTVVLPDGERIVEDRAGLRRRLPALAGRSSEGGLERNRPR